MPKRVFYRSVYRAMVHHEKSRDHYCGKRASGEARNRAVVARRLSTRKRPWPLANLIGDTRVGTAIWFSTHLFFLVGLRERAFNGP